MGATGARLTSTARRDVSGGGQASAQLLDAPEQTEI